MASRKQNPCVANFRDVIENFKFRSYRAAMMNYYLASYYNKFAFRLECVAVVFGAISLLSIVRSVVSHDSPNFHFDSSSILGIIGIAATVIIEMIATSTSSLMPSFSQRAATHNKAASAWQKLEYQAESYLQLLDCREVKEKTYTRWLLKLISRRQEVCAAAVIDESTYNLFDAKKVIGDLKKRMRMFQQYKQMMETIDGDENDERNDDEQAVHESENNVNLCFLFFILCLVCVFLSYFL